MSFITLLLKEEKRLSLGMLMHVKCNHDLSSLIGHILSYLIVYQDMHMLSIDSKDFLKNPLFLVLTLRSRLPCFLHVFYFQFPM
jgi:hypothetical protein